MTDWESAEMQEMAEDEVERLRAENARLRRDAESAVLLLRNLGGMLPGTREVIDAVVGLLDAGG